MRQPWNQKPVVFRIVIDGRRDGRDGRRDGRRDAGSTPRSPTQTGARATPPEARLPWRMIGAVAGAGLLGIWLLRPTKPPRPWIEASRARAKRLEEIEERHLRERELEREHEREARRLTPPPIRRRPTMIDRSRSLPPSPSYRRPYPLGDRPHDRADDPMDSIDDPMDDPVGGSSVSDDIYDEEMFEDLDES